MSEELRNFFCFDGGCRSPSVIDIFGNFIRKYKCRYYKKIKYTKLLNIAKQRLRQLIYLNRVRYQAFERKLWLQKKYFEYRDYLFQIVK